MKSRYKLFLTKTSNYDILRIKIVKTRKRGNCECIATWGRRIPRHYAMPSLKSLNLSIAV